MKRTLALVIGFALLAACSNDLDREPLVGTPRIIAIVADPPEAAPGEDVSIRVLAFDPSRRTLHYTFRLCVDPASFFGGFTPDGSNGVSPPDVVCLPLHGSGNSVTIPGAITQTIATELPMYASMGGLNSDAVEQVLATAGIPLQIRVAVSTTDMASTMETTLVSGMKLVGLTTREQRTTNPPYAYFSVGDSIFLGGFGDSFECTLWFSEPPRFKASVANPDTSLDSNGDLRPDKITTEVALEPLDDPFTWMETYPYFDYASQLHTGREGAYYSWFTTSDVDLTTAHCQHERCHTITDGGDTTQVSATTQPTDPTALTQRGTTWDLPSRPGTYDVWLVVRDGHLGESACHATIEVYAPTP
jgi:hypothetical protein